MCVCTHSNAPLLYTPNRWSAWTTPPWCSTPPRRGTRCGCFPSPPRSRAPSGRLWPSRTGAFGAYIHMCICVRVCACVCLRDDGWLGGRDRGLQEPVRLTPCSVVCFVRVVSGPGSTPSHHSHPHIHTPAKPKVLGPDEPVQRDDGAGARRRGHAAGAARADAGGDREVRHRNIDVFLFIGNVWVVWGGPYGGGWKGMLREVIEKYVVEGMRGRWVGRLCGGGG